MVEYTIAICNYNMGDTIGEALESILDQVDDRFEVLVVDDGSTDESVEEVRRLQATDDRLRLVELHPDPGRHLGATRNVSVRQSNGDHVLTQLDADDVYEPVIEDFVELYEQFRAGRDTEFMLKGSGLTVAPREFLLDRGPYRNLPVGAEDADMWRRLLAEDAVVWLTHPYPAREISEESSMVERLRGSVERGIGVRVGEFQTGLSPASRLRWSYDGYRTGARSLPELVFECLATPYAALTAAFRPSYEPNHPYTEKGDRQRAIDQISGTTREVADRLDVELDPSGLSERGRELFLSE